MLVWKAVVFGPYALFLAYRSLPSRSGRVTNTAIGYGAFMVAVALLTPYVSMYTGVQLFAWPFVVFSIATPLLLAFEIWRVRSGPEPGEVVDRVRGAIEARF